MTMNEHGNIESILCTPGTAGTAGSSISCVGGGGGGGFRECSICLEKLHDGGCISSFGEPSVVAEQPPPRKMTFIVPCGHVFHTDCYHQWNQTRFASHQTLQCATCHGPSASSYYVVADYCCILCRQSLYQSQYDVSFTLPDKRLVHTECWSLFQQHGKPLLLRNSHHHPNHCSRSNSFVPAMIRHRLSGPTAAQQQQQKQRQKQQQHVSFRGAPVKQVYRVFLFAEMLVDVSGGDSACHYYQRSHGLTSLLRDMTQTLVQNHTRSNHNNNKKNNDDDDDDDSDSDDDYRRLVTTTTMLEQLLAMVTVESEIPTTVDTLAAVLASSRASPTRQTAVAAMSRLDDDSDDVVAALATLLHPSNHHHHHHHHHHKNESADESPPQQQQQRDIFEKSCYLLAILCSKHLPNCARAVELGGLASMLFTSARDVSPLFFLKVEEEDRLSMGLRTALTAFVHPAATTTTTTSDDDDDDDVPVIVAAGGIQAILLELQHRPHEAHVQWIGATFLTELLLPLQRIDAKQKQQQQQQRLPWVRIINRRLHRRRLCCFLRGWWWLSRRGSSRSCPTTTAWDQCRTILDEGHAESLTRRAIQLHSDQPAVVEIMNRFLLLLG